MNNLHVLSWRLSSLTSDQFEELLDSQYENQLEELNSHNVGIFNLQTCQRIVIALNNKSSNFNLEEITNQIINIHKWDDKTNICFPEPEQYQGDEAFQYLAMVISGLDSVVIGEEQIQGQFRKAFRTCEEMMNSELTTIMQHILKIGKNVRQESLLSNGKISTIQLGAELISNELEDASAIACIGTGKMGRGVIKFLNKYKDKLEVYTTHPDRAGQIIDDKKIQPLSALEDADILITATSKSHFIDLGFLTTHFATVPKIIMDLGMPRNCHNELIKNQEIQVIDIKRLIEVSRSRKSNDVVSSAHEVLDTEIEKAKTYFDRQKNADLIRQLRSDMLTTAQGKKGLFVEDDPEKDKEFDQFVNKLIHISQQHLEQQLLE